MSFLRSFPLLPRFDRGGTTEGDNLPALNFVPVPDRRDFISISIPDEPDFISNPDGGGTMEGDSFISILSVDGGGIRGIIAAAILSFLEAELQKLDGPSARIAHYFDTIAGTSTGGLITAMLTCPDDNGQPLFTAKEILDFYWKESPKIFPQPRRRMWGLRHLATAIRCFRGPKYDGERLRSVIKKLLGEKRLQDTLTNVVIVAYDTLSNDVVVFSSHEIKKSSSQDALLSDICIGTSAAPGYLPSHYFETIDHSGNITKFNLVDGALAANNPILLAIRETVREVTGGTNDLAEARKHGQFLLLSIGTGTKREDGYHASETKKWGFWDWLYKRGNCPIMNMFDGGSKVMVEQNLPTAIETLRAKDHYFRIQDDTLCGELSSMDKATRKNLNDLMEFSIKLLGKPVSKRNPNTGVLEPCSRETNAEALTRFAKLLSEGRKRRPALNPV